MGEGFGDLFGIAGTAHGAIGAAAAIAADLPQFTTITEFQAALLAIEAVKHNDYQIMSIQEHSKQLFELERREF